MLKKLKWGEKKAAGSSSRLQVWLFLHYLLGVTLGKLPSLPQFINLYIEDNNNA